DWHDRCDKHRREHADRIRPIEESMGSAGLQEKDLSAPYTPLSELKTLDDGAFVAQFLAGQSRSFDARDDRYQNRLLNFIYRTVGDRERAEDLVQEAFIRVHRHIARFDPTKKFSTWIYTIASNLAKNELRNRSRNPLVLFQTITQGWEDEERPLEFEDTSMQPDELYRKRHVRELVEDAVARLPEHHREVFVLRELEGRS